MQEQRAFWAAVITGLMWIAVIVVSAIFMAMEGVTPLGAAIFVIMLAGIAVGGTAAVWDSLKAAPSAPEVATAGGQRRKAKRFDPERLARLMDTLDEDQIIELESLLLAQDETRLDEQRGR